MPRKTMSSLLACICTGVLIFLLTACGSASGSAPTTTKTAAGSTSANPPGTTTITQTAHTPSMPAAQTSCPLPIETGRAAVMRPLALGSDPAIAYIFNTGTQANPSFAELKWYDVANGNKTVITHLSNEYITGAQVSSDGQWILFVTDYPQYDALQLVRMDGQGLQTLYCTTRKAIQGVQWSPDQSRVIFSVRSISGLLNLYLLNMANGQVQPELVLPNNANTGFLARTWANNSLIYIAGVPRSQQGPASEKGLYLLNTRNGPNQSPGELETVIVPSSSTCWDFDSDFNETTLAASQCNGSFSYSDIRAGILQGPSAITRGTIIGEQPHPIYQNDAGAVTQVRFLGYSSSSLLFTINSESMSTPGIPIDSSHNGVWKMNTDGSDATELASESRGYLCELNLFSQYPWANVSRNSGAYYVVQISSLGNGTTPPTYLEYGSVNGGSLKSFAFAYEFNGSLAIAGWTTM